MAWFTVVVVTATFIAESAFAGTLAYWRHEEGPDGGLIAAGANTVLDSSGNANHMQTFDPSFTSASYTSSVSPLPLRSGLPNTLSLDFGPGGDDAGLNDDNYSDGKPINSQLFSALTAELAFNMDSVGPGQFQALLGKDGDPLGAGGVVAPLKIMVRGDDYPNATAEQLFVEWIDGDGDVHSLAGGSSVTTGSWNHIAFVLTATDAELYVWGPGDSGYVLVDSKTDDFAGGSGEVLFDSTAAFSVGRGAYDGGVTDWADALIDEVRISDMALSSSEFLFVPEPSSCVLASLALLAVGSLLARRKTASCR